MPNVNIDPNHNQPLAVFGSAHYLGHYLAPVGTTGVWVIRTKSTQVAKQQARIQSNWRKVCHF
jgi:hypothetical protein